VDGRVKKAFDWSQRIVVDKGKPAQKEMTVQGIPYEDGAKVVWDADVLMPSDVREIFQGDNNRISDRSVVQINGARRLKIKNSSSEYISKLNAEISHLKGEKMELEGKLGLFNQAERSKTRLKELEQERQELSEKIEYNEKMLYLLDQFTVSKVNLLESQINSKFDNVVFTLFEKQVNGGISDVCYATYKGVRYDSMNNGARINCSLDIIQTLSKHYGISVPVFVDNAESVTGLKQIDGQVISLFVDERYDKLIVKGDA